jgi:hypothetical protein
LTSTINCYEQEIPGRVAGGLRRAQPNLDAIKRHPVHGEELTRDRGLAAGHDPQGQWQGLGLKTVID